MMLRKLKYVLLFYLVFFFPISGFASGKVKSIPEENCKPYVLIKGSSNVNEFQFINYEPRILNSSGSIKEENLIRIPVYSFTTANTRMLNDFHEMVKANNHPFIDISIEPRQQADFDEGSGLTNFKTKVTIAGSSKSYIVPSAISGCDKRGYMLQGDLQVKLTDFDIEPPTKLLGAVKVNNEVFIKFAFRIQNEEQLTEQLQE